MYVQRAAPHLSTGGVIASKGLPHVIQKARLLVPRGCLTFRNRWGYWFQGAVSHHLIGGTAEQEAPHKHQRQQEYYHHRPSHAERRFLVTLDARCILPELTLELGWVIGLILLLEHALFALHITHQLLKLLAALVGIDVYGTELTRLSCIEHSHNLFLFDV